MYCTTGVTASSGDDSDALWLVNCCTTTLRPMSSLLTVKVLAHDWRVSFT